MNETSTAPTDLEPGKPGEPGEPTPTHGNGHAHPTPIQYVGIAIVLFIATAIEVALYYIERAGHLGDYMLVALLIGIAVIKFGLVAAYFMHLKFDSLLLRRLFIGGILLAGTVYLVALLTMDVLVG